MSCLSFPLRPKKKPLFLEMRVTRKIFTRAFADLFFLIDFLERYSLFFFNFFVFFHSCFFCLFICCFLKLKIYIPIHVRLSWRVNDKNLFTRSISGNKTTFFFGLTTASLTGFGRTKVMWRYQIVSQGIRAPFPMNG